ncbi:MAG: hypothetical protein N4A68_18765 [Maledivibacter sp.]|nr:hypothetical protein [Maledivibacter sp.]
MDSGSLGLFNIDYLSSVTAMVMAVNLITQIIKEIYLSQNGDKRVPRLLNLLVSFFVVSLHHINVYINDSLVFHNNLIELTFLIVLNTFLIAGLSMGNYKVLGLTKERNLRDKEKSNRYDL